MMLLLLIATLPVVLLFLFFYYKDKFEKEPPKTMFRAFTGGILSIFPVFGFFVLFPQLMNQDIQEGISMSMSTSFISAFLSAAVPEELSKLLFLYLFIWRNKHFNEYYDGILYAVLVALGFAWVENIMYVQEGGLGTGISRALLAVPGHALFGVSMGYYFSHARFDAKNQFKYLMLSAVIPILAHGTYDFLVFSMIGKEASNKTFTLFTLLIIFDIWLWSYCLKKCNEHSIRVIARVTEDTNT